jgi:hypothetical protein
LIINPDFLKMEGNPKVLSELEGFALESGRNKIVPYDVKCQSEQWPLQKVSLPGQG